MEEQQRPFVMVDGKKYVLAADEHFEQKPEPEIFQWLTGPPRSISLTVRLLLLLSNGHAPLLGWFFACFGMIFCILFAPVGLKSLADLTHRNFKLNGKGHVVEVTKTNTSVNDTSVYRFVFEDADGRSGKCFATGQRFKEGAEVDLEKCGDRTRIVGSRLSHMGGIFIIFIPFVFLFPIIGIAVVFYGALQGKKAIHLLQDGEIGRGRYLDMKLTGTKVNHQSVMKLHYQFEAADGETYDAYATALDTEKLTDDPVEPLLYDPLDPTKSVLLDSLPGNVRFDEFEGIFKANPFRVFLPTLFCLVFLAEVAVMIYAFSIGGILPMN